MGRPSGVTAIAVLDFLFTGFCVLFGLVMIFAGGFVATLINQQGGQGSAGAAGIFAGIGAAAGVFIIIIGGVCALLGIGLWKLKEWGRIINIVLWGLNGLLQVLGLFGTLAHFTVFGFLWHIFWLVIDALIIWYLLKPEVKAAFQPRPMASAASA